MTKPEREEPKLIIPAELTQSKIKGIYVVVTPSPQSVDSFELLKGEPTLQVTDVMRYSSYKSIQSSQESWRGAETGANSHDDPKPEFFDKKLQELRAKALQEAIQHFKKFDLEYLLIDSFRHELQTHKPVYDRDGVAAVYRKRDYIHEVTLRYELEAVAVLLRR